MPSAVARDPSICFSIPLLSRCSNGGTDSVMGRSGRGHIGFAELAGKRLPDRRRDRMQMNAIGERCESTEQCRVWKRPADMFQGELACRSHTRVPVREPRRFLADMKLLETLAGIDQEIACGFEALEYVGGLEQGRILHNQAIRLQDRLAQPDLLVGNAAEGNDGR